MRELPEYEVLSKYLQKAFKGKTLVEFKVQNSKKLNELELAGEEVKGKTITNIYRSGRELHIQFKDSVVLGINLMLHGNLQLFKKENKHKFTIVEMNFTGGEGLALTDWRGTAVVKLNPEENKGIDALSNDLYNYLVKALQSKAQIKKLLTNQDVIRGLGNVYADEILWDARISPFSKSSAVPEYKIAALATSISNVLLNAEKHITHKISTLFTTETHDFLNVFGKAGDPSPTGGIIKVDKKASASTYYTDEQILYK